MELTKHFGGFVSSREYCEACCRGTKRGMSSFFLSISTIKYCHV